LKFQNPAALQKYKIRPEDTLVKSKVFSFFGKNLYETVIIDAAWGFSIEPPQKVKNLLFW
jgi:hypothetical protein